MAVWETGVPWAPTRQMWQNNYKGALDHIALKFGDWNWRLALEIHLHKTDLVIEDARRRSGTKRQTWAHRG